MQSLLNPNMLAYHGPDTIAHLQGFSIDSIIEEFTTKAPDVMDLIRQLGNCGRFEGTDSDDEKVRAATLRTATSLCAILKCRSTKVLGLQLFLSIMLIVRAAHKQVWILKNKRGVITTKS